MEAFMPDPVIIQQTIQVEHIKIESKNSFSDVKAALESLVPQARRQGLRAFAIR